MREIQTNRKTQRQRESDKTVMQTDRDTEKERGREGERERGREGKRE